MQELRALVPALDPTRSLDWRDDLVFLSLEVSDAALFDPGLKPAQMTEPRREVERRLQSAIETNLADMLSRPQPTGPSRCQDALWRTGHWHALLNKYTVSEGHGIDWHQDKGKTYVTTADPITSVSYGESWPLLIRHKEAAKGPKSPKPGIPVLVVPQGPGEAFEHRVPSFRQWMETDSNRTFLRIQPERPRRHWMRWIVGADTDLWEDLRAHWHEQMQAPLLATRVRTNVTLRWRRNHRKLACPYAQRAATIMPDRWAETFQATRAIFQPPTSMAPVLSTQVVRVATSLATRSVQTCETYAELRRELDLETASTYSRSDQ